MLWNIQAIGASLVPHFGALVGGYRTRNDVWYKSLNKPSFTPPDWVYAPVSTGLYTGMGYASYLVWRDAGRTFGGAATLPLGLYASQLALNWAWPEIYFKRQSLKWSLIDMGLLHVSAAACACAFYRVNKTAGHVMLVYLAWLTVGVAINYRLYIDNPQPGLDSPQSGPDSPKPSLDSPKPSLDKPQQKPSLDNSRPKSGEVETRQKSSEVKTELKPNLDNPQQKSVEVKTELKPSPDKTEPKMSLSEVEQKPRDVIPEPKSLEVDPERTLRKVNFEPEPKEFNPVPEPRRVNPELKPKRAEEEERRKKEEEEEEEEGEEEEGELI